MCNNNNYYTNNYDNLVHLFQSFYMCTPGGDEASFLCPNGTSKISVCFVASRVAHYKCS